MILSTSLQNAYVDMYKEVRNYIWGIDVVEKLAELELSVYQALPDITDIKKKFNTFYSYVKTTAKEDNELQGALQAFRDMLDSADDVALKLTKVQEVISR